MAPKQDYTPSEGRRTTGVFAPRRNNKPKYTPVSPPSGTDWTFQNPDVVIPQRQLSVEDAANQIMAGFPDTPTPTTTGMGTGGRGNAYTNAIKILQKELGGGQYGASYDNLSTLLGTTSGTARGQIDQATANAIAQINRQDPLATPINYSAGTTQIPQTALNNYLNAIGASTSSVDAGRNFLQGLIDTGASSAAQSQASQQQAYAAQRQAAIDALTGNQQLQQGNLTMNTQAQQMAIARAKEQERKALQDQILQFVLQGGVA
jgi:hypothetical protein